MFFSITVSYMIGSGQVICAYYLLSAVQSIYARTEMSAVE